LGLFVGVGVWAYAPAAFAAPAPDAAPKAEAEGPKADAGDANEGGEAKAGEAPKEEDKAEPKPGLLPSEPSESSAAPSAPNPPKEEAKSAEDPGSEPAAEPVEVDEGEDPDVGELADLLGSSVVQTASRSAEDESTAPATMTVVTAEDLRNYGITSIKEVVNYFGLGMSYQEDGGAAGTTTITGRGVAVPGDGGSHVLVLVNGHKTNDSWGGWANIDERMALPMEIIDRVEIINGPGAVMYGTSAMYGVINIVTKDAEQYAGVHAVAQGKLGFPGDSRNGLIGPRDGHSMGWGARASVGVAHPFDVGDKHGSILVQAEYVEDVRPTHVFGPQSPDWDPGPIAYPDGDWGGIGAPQQRAVGGFIGFRLGKWALDIRGVHWNRRHLEDYQSDFNDPENRESGQEVRVDLRHRAPLKPGLELRSRVFGDAVPYKGNWIYSDPSWCAGLTARCRSYEEDVAAIYGLEEVLTWDWFVDNHYVTLFGADVRGRTVQDKIDVEELISGTSVGLPGFADYTVTTVAGSLFVQQLIRPVPKFGMNLGARLDLDQLFGAHVSPRAAVMVHPWKGGTLKTLYSEAFRAPVAGEVNFADPTYHVQAEDLDAEVVRSVELSVEQRLPDGMGRVRAGGYASWWSGLVGERALSQEEFDDAVANGALVPEADPDYSVTYDNFGKMFAAGAFASANLQDRTGYFRFGTNVSFTQSWVDDEGDRLDVARVPDWIVNMRASIVPGGYTPTFAVATFYNSPRRTVGDVDGEFEVGNIADHLVRTRFVLSGDIPKAPGLKYRFYTDYSFGKYGPYVRGQLNYAEDDTFGGELTPLDRLYLFLGLRWDFDYRKGARK
jgi:outer membrane receptor protein involved in Fe transport